MLFPRAKRGARLDRAKERGIKIHGKGYSLVKRLCAVNNGYVHAVNNYVKGKLCKPYHHIYIYIYVDLLQLVMLIHNNLRSYTKEG